MDRTRRNFLKTGAGLAAAPAILAENNNKLALLGGTPVRSTPFPSWPKIGDSDERAVAAVLRSGKWNRLNGPVTSRFEQTWAELLGAKHCVATANGTSALFTSLNALDVGPKDEVIIPPYTFVATVNVVLLQHALPVFVDTDLETCQIDATKLEAAITPRTRAIIPVHMGGSVVDMDKVLAVAKKQNVAVIEDACQAHLAEWHKRKVSTLGDLGCFSFQASKNLNSGEGGAILSNNTELIERCRSFHNNGRWKGEGGFSYGRNGANLRLTEFQAAILLEQLTRLDEQSRTRERNADYLTSMLKEIPAVRPARMYDGCTRNAYHLYMMRYDKAAFANKPRPRFLQALRAEGIPCSAGYSPLNKETFLKNTFNSRAYKAIYTAKEIAEWEQRNHCPANDRLCEEAVWFGQTMLLGPRSDMDQVAEAIRKAQKQAHLL